MKIIKPKPEPEKHSERAAWIAKFKALTGATWAPTKHRTLAVIRFKFSCGAVAEWHWQDQTPEEAAQEAFAAGIAACPRAHLADSEEPGEDLEPDPCKLCGRYYAND